MKNPLGSSKLAIEAIKKESGNINIYPDGAVIKLRNKSSKKYNVLPEKILIGNGGEQIITLIAHTFINEGDEIIMATPSFILYDIMSKHIGANVVLLPLTKDFKHDFKLFLDNITGRTKIVYVYNPNNPTGNILTKKEVTDFVLKLPKECVLVLDEAYFEYVIHDSEYIDGLEILKNRPNTIILRTFYKVAELAGLRVGYVFSSPEIITEMNKIKGVFNTNRLAQIASIAALDDEEYLKKTVNLNKQSLDRMKEYFDENKLYYVPTHTNFIFVNVDVSFRIVYEELLKRGVNMRLGFLWGLENYIRVSSSTIKQAEIFIEKLDEVLKSL